jgi:hypothetical protein
MKPQTLQLNRMSQVLLINYGSNGAFEDRKADTSTVSTVKVEK